MKEVTIDGVTYVPVVHTRAIDGTARCKDCAAYNHANNTMDTIDLCIKLPDCWDGEHSCHFIKETP